MNKWFIGIKNRGDDPFDLSGLTILKTGAGKYWADPFVVEYDGRTFLFMEETDYTKGYLVCAELNENLEIKNIRKILDLPTHCSFPSVVRFGGEWYMAPENVLSGELWIYKATEFPYKWEKYHKVSGGRFDDPILSRKDGFYYIHTSADGDKRRVFRCANPHSLNGQWDLVFSVDEPYARRAGHDFVHPTFGVVSPMQDSVPVYGRGMVFKDSQLNTVHRIDVGDVFLDTDDVLTGIHTFNVSEHLVCVDMRVKISE